jgi:hypothetical protein
MPNHVAVSLLEDDYCTSLVLTEGGGLSLQINSAQLFRFGLIDI